MLKTNNSMAPLITLTLRTFAPSICGLFLTFFVVTQSGTAQDLASLADPTAVTGTAAVGVQFKPEYYEEPGQSAFVGLSLRRNLNEVSTLGLSTRFTALRKPSGPNGDRMVPGNPTLRLSRQFAGVSGFVSGSPGLNRWATETGLLANLSSGLMWQTPMDSKTDFSVSGTWIKPLYKHTLASNGTANINHEFDFSLGLSVRMDEHVTFDVSTGRGQQFFHSYGDSNARVHFWPSKGSREWTNSNSVGMSVQTSEKTSLEFSVATSNSVLRPDGKREAWLLYRPDQSQAELVLRRTL